LDIHRVPCDTPNDRIYLSFVVRVAADLRVWSATSLCGDVGLHERQENFPLEGVSVTVAGGATTHFRIRLRVDNKGRECRIKPSLRCLSIRCILSWLYLIKCAS
ncbi:unnamed protein product, partial [Ectocarpus sp. 12 AP-2014]